MNFKKFLEASVKKPTPLSELAEFFKSKGYGVEYPSHLGSYVINIYAAEDHPGSDEMVVSGEFAPVNEPGSVHQHLERSIVELRPYPPEQTKWTEGQEFVMQVQDGGESNFTPSDLRRALEVVEHWFKKFKLN